MTDPKRAVAILAFVVFLVMLGFGLVIPVLPYYSMSLGASSFDLGLLMGVYSFMQFIFAPRWGKLGDVKGRKSILLVGIGGFAVTFALYGLAHSFRLLFFFRTLSGIFSSAAMPTAMAMVADLTAAEERGRYMGLIGAMTGLGMIVGPALGGVLANVSHTLPFYTAALLAAVNFVLAGLILQETGPAGPGPSKQENKAKTSRPAGFPLGKEAWSVLRSPVAIFMILNLAVSFVNANFESTFAYLAADNYGLDPAHLGIAFMAMGIITVILQAGLLGKLIARFGEAALLKTGIFVIALSFLLIPLAGGLSTLIGAICVTAVGLGLMRPCLNSLVSKRTEAGQGLAMGVLASVDSLGRISGPVAGGALYLISHFLPYRSSAAIMIIMGLVALRSPLLKAAGGAEAAGEG